MVMEYHVCLCQAKYVCIVPMSQHATSGYHDDVSVVFVEQHRG